MKKINYPMLCYELQPQLVLGVVVGSNYQIIEKDKRSARAALTYYLQNQYRKDGLQAFGLLRVPKMKMVQISIKPSYIEAQGYFPLSFTVQVPVAAVYGEALFGNNYTCYLPILEKYFHYYDNKQLDTLIRHFATGALNNMQPEAIFQLLRYPKPILEIIEMKVKDTDRYDWYSFHQEQVRKNLNTLTEPFPLPRSVRKRLSALPDVAWEQEEKVQEIMEKIMGARANVLVVGNSGSGKSAILGQAIRKITGPMLSRRIGLTFWRMLSQRITANAKYLGEWEQTVEELIEELTAANGVLWIEDIIQLLQTGGWGAEDSVAAFMITFLQQGKLQIIGEVTPQELESMRRLLPSFVACFQIVPLEELPEPKIQRILDKLSAYIEKNMAIVLEKEALMLAYRLLARYYPYKSFPGKAITFLGTCISEAKMHGQSQMDRATVLQHFVTQTGLPELFLRDDLLLDQTELQAHFEQHIIGQPEAIRHLMRIVKIYKAGLNNPNKPIATMLFAGPTGVGKTACAKVLADYFFGKGQKQSPLIRIDMSEFQYPGQISRLIGQGREVGQLVKDLRERPFAVLLLDEIEKADPSVFDALLTVLDEGALVDAYGRITNFRNTIIIMTSNLGASNRPALGFNPTDNEKAIYQSAIENYFRPEFFNRIDHLVFFAPLTAEAIQRIIRKELNDLRQREGFVKRHLHLNFSEALIEHIVHAGFDQRYGARPLQRAIEQLIIHPVAQWLLSQANPDNCSIYIDYDNTVKITKLNEND
ncbi:MAG TPA: AAA family ATPase [Saprospiraceae bacterium]|nr:AAA family ATPase [Saprospiraceae bacterium]HMP14077.1 AAA family ATPase [Saprospiraceae bacterium]